MRSYCYPALTPEEQISLLVQKGLIITDLENAKRWLKHVGYFRLNVYMRHFKDYNGREGRFLEGTDFKHIIDLYSFDRDLRDIIFDGIEMIEVAVKSLISDRMSCKHGPHWYLNSSNFTSSYDSAGLESFLKENCNQQSDYHFIRGYMREFTTPEFPPSWMIMELLTFGKISLMFEHLGDPEVRNDICHYFGSAKNLLPSWLHAFTFIRNKCAHHSKLVFTTTPIRPVMPIRQNKRFLNEAEIVDNASLYCILACMQFVISKIDPDARFKERLLNLIAKFPDFDYRQMGFTPEWQKEDLFLISNPSQQYYSPTPGGRELLS